MREAVITDRPATARATATAVAADRRPRSPRVNPKWAARRRAGTRMVHKAVALLIALTVWHVFAVTEGAAAGIPTPLQLLATASDLVVTGEYWSAVGNTLVSAVIGFVLSVVVGVPLGLVNGTFRSVERSTRFVVDFGRTIPGVAILPLVLLLFGSTRSMVLVLVMFSAVWPILIQSTYAAQQLSSQMRQVARAFRLSRTSRVRDVYLPSALPFIMTGLRIAATISLLITISSEFLGGANGLGQRLFQTLVVNDNDRMFVYVVSAALLGVLLNWFLVVTQRKVLWWHPSERGAK